MTGERNYRYSLRMSNSGTQYLLICEAQPALNQPAQHWTALVENLNLLKSGFQKAFRLVTRRASI